jgi:geranylgeranyl pyrophosphate synthase
MIVGTEESIKKYFPTRWTKKEIVFFIGKSRFEIDSTSLNKNINIPIRDFVFRGGKRLRPILFLTCIELFGFDYRKYFDFAAFIELIHNGTLVLDDIEDGGVLRRGKPTCHIKFGIDTATNVGASLHFLPLKIILSKREKLDEEMELKIWRIVTEELINVSFGQGLDIYWHKNKFQDEISVTRYLEMVRLKTGSLMRLSVRLACVLAGKDGKTTALFEEFAESLGMAFQIIDDSLDLGSPGDKFGKAYGNDITEGKISLPVIYTLKNLGEEKKKRLIEVLRKHTRDRMQLKEAISLIKESGSVRKSVKFANRLVDDAWHKLENGWGKKNNLNKLHELTYFIVKRNY